MNTLLIVSICSLIAYLIGAVTMWLAMSVHARTGWRQARALRVLADAYRSRLAEEVAAHQQVREALDIEWGLAPARKPYHRADGTPCGGVGAS